MKIMQRIPLMKFIAVAMLFASAMGILESVVAYYLRLMYYPEGFSFPLAMIPAPVLKAEIIREAATIVMLLTVALLAAHTNLTRFMLFLFLFGVWDIVYYLGLKLFLGWPSSLLTWDLLFLIPFPWTAPVLAPVICSLLFITMALVVFGMQYRNRLPSAGWKELTLFFAGLMIILYTFIADSLSAIIKAINSPGDLLSPDAGLSSKTLFSFVPEEFAWGIFLAGTVVVILSFLIILRKAIPAEK